MNDIGRYAAVRSRYPELISAQPQWRHTCAGDWTAALPSREDVQVLANLVAHTGVIINVSATMTLDFAIHDKPVVNLAYDVGGTQPFGVSLWDFHYQFEHYRPVIELGAARFARTPDELARHTNACLLNPDLDQDGRKRFVELEIALPLGESSRAIIDTLRHIAETRVF